MSINALSRTCSASPSGSRPARIAVYHPGLLYQSQTMTSTVAPIKDAYPAAHRKALIEATEPSMPDHDPFTCAFGVCARHDRPFSGPAWAGRD